MILPSTVIHLLPDGVTFVNTTAQGTQIVRIELRHLHPRVTATTIVDGHSTPMTLDLPEFIEFVTTAQGIWASRFLPDNGLTLSSGGVPPQKVCHMKLVSADVKSDRKVVGTVTVPEFEASNPGIGVEEIKSYDWTPFGYKSWQDAVVTLVNTQHATNIKNKLRAEKSGRITDEQLTQMAIGELGKDLMDANATGNVDLVASLNPATQPANFMQALKDKKAAIKTRLGLDKKPEAVEEEDEETATATTTSA